MGEINAFPLGRLGVARGGNRGAVLVACTAFYFA